MMICATPMKNATVAQINFSSDDVEEILWDWSQWAMGKIAGQDDL